MNVKFISSSCLGNFCHDVIDMENSFVLGLGLVGHSVVTLNV